MSFNNHECFTVVCDGCGQVHEHDETEVHFPDRETASRDAREYGEWVVIGGQALCERCVAARECAMLRHRWDAWTTVQNQQYATAVRQCDACWAREWSPGGIYQ